MVVGSKLQGIFSLKESPLYSYVLEGDPIPWMRARVRSKIFYDGQKALKLMRGIPLRNQHGDNPPVKGAVALRVIFYMPMPKGWSEKKRLSMVGAPHYIRPDIDNLQKFLKDVAVDAEVLHDDCIIVEVSAAKVYAEHARTEFMIYEVV